MGLGTIAISDGYSGHIHADSISLLRPASALTIPTYDGGNEAVHPSVLYIPGGFAGKRWWMAMTPYPGGDDDYENPSILCSDDGVTWAAPDGLTNPIEAFPGGSGHNFDPCLAMKDETLYCFYGTSADNVNASFCYRTSADGVTWSDRTDIDTGLDLNFLSPSIMWDNSAGLWRLWYADKTDGAAAITLQYAEATTIAGLDYANSTECTITYPSGFTEGTIWHPGIRKIGDSYVACFNTTFATSSANWVATSYDGTTWDVGKDPEIKYQTGLWDKYPYRGEFVFETPTRGWLYYSGATAADGTWSIGRAPFSTIIEPVGKTGDLTPYPIANLGATNAIGDGAKSLYAVGTAAQVDRTYGYYYSGTAGIESTAASGYRNPRYVVELQRTGTFGEANLFEALVITGDGALTIDSAELLNASSVIPHEVGGLEADVSAYDGLVKITGGSTSAVTVTSAGEAILDDEDASAQRTTLGLVIGTDVLAPSAIDDTAYGAGWDADTTHAPSKNAVYDKIESLAGGHDAVTLDVNADAFLSLSTQELGLDTQTANYGFMGPTTGDPAVPAFRALVAADIPDLSGTYDVAGSASTAVGTHESTYNHSNYNTAYTHTTNTSNPHSVTATQVGLGSVANVDTTPVALAFVIDGGGSAITTGIKGDVQVPFAGTITAVTLLADQSGSIVVDIWKDTYANFPPTDADSITASAPPTITTATKNTDSTLTDWTTSITAGDILRFNVDSDPATDITRVTLILEITRS